MIVGSWVARSESSKGVLLVYAPAARPSKTQSVPPNTARGGLRGLAANDQDRADPALIPDFSENAKPGWTGVYGTLHVKANYQLLIDNILDLTHVVFVHKTTLAGGGVAETPLEVDIDGDVVRVQRLMHNVDTAPIYKAARNLHGKIDRWQFLEFRPPIYARITLGAREAGSDLAFGTPTHVVQLLPPHRPSLQHGQARKLPVHIHLLP